MPSKLQAYTELSQVVVTRLTSSYQEWTGFLAMMGRIYKYPYREQLMIYAQRPDATACASYELWSKQMRRYVMQGARGIALIDTSTGENKVRYVFDVSDTREKENARRPWLWQYRPEHQERVAAALEARTSRVRKARFTAPKRQNTSSRAEATPCRRASGATAILSM